MNDTNVLVLLRILFIDAGPTRSAWVVVEVRSDGAIVPVQGGWRSMLDDAWLGAVMVSVWEVGGVVALEYIDGGLYDRKRWRDLLETARIEGEIRRTARTRGADHALLPWREMPARWRAMPRTLFCVPASSWRLELLGRPNPRNVEIEVVVNYLAGRTLDAPKPGGPTKVIDLPGIDSKSREHVVDALGGAIVVASVILGARIKIPDDIRGAQEAARTKAGARKATLRALSKLGVGLDQARSASGEPLAETLGKRKPSRGVRAGQRAVTLNSRDHGGGKRAR